MRYGKGSAVYSPLNEKMDSSHAIPPWGDIYDPNTPVVPDDPNQPVPSPKQASPNNTIKIIIIVVSAVLFVVIVTTTILCCRKKSKHTEKDGTNEQIRNRQNEPSPII